MKNFIEAERCTEQWIAFEVVNFPVHKHLNNMEPFTADCAHVCASCAAVFHQNESVRTKNWKLVRVRGEGTSLKKMCTQRWSRNGHLLLQANFLFQFLQFFKRKFCQFCKQNDHFVNKCLQKGTKTQLTAKKVRSNYLFATWPEKKREEHRWSTENRWRFGVRRQLKKIHHVSSSQLQAEHYNLLTHISVPHFHSTFRCEVLLVIFWLVTLCESRCEQLTYSWSSVDSCSLSTSLSLSSDDVFTGSSDSTSFAAFVPSFAASDLVAVLLLWRFLWGDLSMFCSENTQMRMYISESCCSAQNRYNER